jgi:hypothetical protein
MKTVAEAQLMWRRFLCRKESDLCLHGKRLTATKYGSADETVPHHLATRKLSSMREGGGGGLMIVRWNAKMWLCGAVIGLPFTRTLNARRSKFADARHLHAQRNGTR